ncbi:hypothetical protein [Streptomonospora arabica]|uniref:hypothetical protein n=1 Tax=Streptomonospora arabica TaxID=412417 RepID=UPI0031D909F9
MELSRAHSRAGPVPARGGHTDRGARSARAAPAGKRRGGAGGPRGGAGSWVRRGSGALRAALLGAAALRGRIAAAWIAAAWAWEALAGGPRTDLAAGAVLACAAAFAAGLAARPAGLVLAAAAPLAQLRMAQPPAGPGIPHAAGPEGASAALLPSATAAPWWIALAAVCLLGALTPGRISLDALLTRRRGRRRTLRSGANAVFEDERIGRRPEEAPPLPYPGGRVESTRPSRI